MNFIINNWSLLIAIVAVIAVAASFIIKFKKLPTQTQIKKLKEWLLWAVTEAEKQLGGGTGRIKLRYVYDMFIERFPSIAKLISFDYFSVLVDEALEEFRKLLSTNQKINQYVNTEKE